MVFLNWIDIICLILLFIGSYVGFRKGLIFEVFHFTGITVALFLALHKYQPLAGVLSRYCFLPPTIARIISFIIIIIAVIVIFKLAAFFIQRAVKIKVVKKIDKIGGVVFGLVRYLIITSLILIFFLLIPWPYLRNSINERSVIGRHLVKVAPAIYSGLVKFFPGYRDVGISQVLEGITEEE